MKKFSALLICGFSLAVAASWGWSQNGARETPTGQIEGSRAQTAYLKRASGFNALRGPGAIIILRDRDPRDSAAIVHDYDLLMVIHQLKAAGAEAIAINGARLGNHTAIRVAGPTILMGNGKLQPPFKIEAIGDGAWFGKIMKTSGLADSFDEAGPQMSVFLSDDVRVPALQEAPSFRFARPE